jgi:hypothetical protein
VADKIFFLAETVEAASRSIVLCGRGGWAKEEWFLLYALGELLFCGVGGVGACKEGVGDVLRLWRGRVGHFVSFRPEEWLEVKVAELGNF